MSNTEEGFTTSPTSITYHNQEMHTLLCQEHRVKLTNTLKKKKLKKDGSKYEKP